MTEQAMAADLVAAMMFSGLALILITKGAKQPTENQVADSS